MTLLQLLNNSLLSDTDRTFTNDFCKTPYFAYKPNADLIETENGYELTFDVPGFNQENLSIKVENGVLKVDGTTKTGDNKEEKEEKKRYLLQERYNREFHRAFKLPENIDREQIKANLKDGVLRVNLEKHPEEKPKQIEIK